MIKRIMKPASFGYSYGHKDALLTVEQTRSADQLTIQNDKSGYELLTEAGLQVYKTALEFLTTADRILIACGSGNNGGDGFVAAKQLLDDGFEVTVALLGSSDSISGDARLAFDVLHVTPENLHKTKADNFTVIIDALLGSGLDRPITGKLAHWIQDANNSSALIVSVDIPSGICGDSGAVLGTAIEAQHTVTFFRKKPGHVLYPGRQHCGVIHVRQIGISQSVLDVLEPTIYENNLSLWQKFIPNLAWHHHKYSRGHVIVVTGNAISAGAARLAARAALRTGAGLVTLVCPSTAANNVASQVTCEMVKVVDTADDLQQLLKDKRITSVVLGPGLGIGYHTQQLVRVALCSTASVVLDADALTSYENFQAELFALIADAKNGVVVTPHTGEFNRIFTRADHLNEIDPDGIAPDISTNAGAPTNVGTPTYKNKVLRSIEAANISGATVVFKGPDTVIANPMGHSVINTNAPHWLATAGSGDVLAGTIAGLLAQGVDEFHSACIGCWMHGEAANAFGPGLIATDIAEQYPSIQSQLMDSNYGD